MLILENIGVMKENRIRNEKIIAQNPDNARIIRNIKYKGHWLVCISCVRDATTALNTSLIITLLSFEVKFPN